MTDSRVSWGGKGGLGDGRAGAKKCQAGLGGLLGKESELPPASSGHLEEGFGVIRFIFQSGHSVWLEWGSGPMYLTFSKRSCSNQRKARLVLGAPDVGENPSGSIFR